MVLPEAEQWRAYKTRKTVKGKQLHLNHVVAERPQE